MIENGKKVIFNIAQGLHKGFATITESKKDEDDKHILYRLTDIECTSEGIEMHNNEDGELWVNDFEVIEVPKMCTSKGIELHDNQDKKVIKEGEEILEVYFKCECGTITAQHINFVKNWERKCTHCSSKNIKPITFSDLLPLQETITQRNIKYLISTIK